MNRLLSKERRAEILMESERWLVRGILPQMIHELLEAEAFWREAVKNAPEFAEYDGGALYCNFCGAKRTARSVDHKPDCAWLLAQEGQ